MTMPGMLDTNRTTYKAKQEERIIKARKTLRRQRRNRYIGYALAAVLGLGVGTAIVNSTEADAATQTQINRFIKAEGGIPPCQHEDAVLKVNGKKVTCVWWAGQRGNGKGDSFLRTANDDLIYITGPKAVRY